MRRSCERAVERRGGTVRAVWLAVLTLGLLAVVPSMAQALSVTDFSTFPNGGPSVPTMGFPFGLQVTYSDWLYVFDHGEVYEETGGRRVTLTDTCIYNGCTVNVDPVASDDYAHAPTRTFEVVLYTDRNIPYGNTTLVVNERRLHFGLRGDFDWSPGLFHVAVSGSIGNTDLETIIYEDGRAVTSCDVVSSYCTTPVTSGAVYYAAVEDPDGNVYGMSPSYLATSSTTGTKETADKVDLPRLALLYPTSTDVCDELLTYPGGTHVAESTVNDQALACQAAVTNRDTMSDLLRAVATAGGGTSVLWWLMHDGTVSQLSTPTPWPDYELPATRDLPLSWQAPVINVADHYKLQERGKDLTAEAAETLSRACLWNVSRIGNGRTDCSELPVFFSGSDVAEATEHDLEAIAGENGVSPHPEWVKLNYEYGAGKERYQNRDWYKSVSPCDVRTTPAGQQCDEYPFWASEQGGAADLVPPPHLRFIDRTDNGYQGSRFGNFVTSCGLRSGPPPESGGNARGGDVFLMIPVPPDLGIPTTWLCNRD